MNAVSLVLVSFCLSLSFVSCSKETKDKTFGTRSTPIVFPSSTIKPEETPVVFPSSTIKLEETPAPFAELLEQTSILKDDINSFVWHYYMDPDSQSPLGANLKRVVASIPTLITEAITILCTRLISSDTPLDFYGVPISRSRASTLTSHLEQTYALFSEAQNALNEFYSNDPARMSQRNGLSLQRRMKPLQARLGGIISELRALKF
jgi:hypothetical protein